MFQSETSAAGKSRSSIFYLQDFPDIELHHLWFEAVVSETLNTQKTQHLYRKPIRARVTKHSTKPIRASVTKHCCNTAHVIFQLLFKSLHLDEWLL